MSSEIILILLIAIVAFFYASVGHGGASGYLALMVLFGMSPLVMKPSALLLNIFVSAIAFFQYYRQGYFKFKLLLPFIIASIPLSFLGAKIHIETHMYKMILAACLFLAILRLLGVFGKYASAEFKEVNFYLAVLIGGVIGLISGMIGIGGGIILSPVILLFRWADMKQTAAVSAAFIFLNSVAGIAGALPSLGNISVEIYFWVIAGIAGGTVGAFYGSSKFNHVILKYILSIVLVFACVKLVIS